MYFLIYLSTASSLLSDEDLRDILLVSRRNNERNDITGMLLYHEGVILQVLEGDKLAVLDVFQRLQSDNRHHSVFKILDGQTANRYFSNWSMGFRRLSNMQWTELSGYMRISNSKLQFENADGTCPEMITFIRSFCEVNFK